MNKGLGIVMATVATPVAIGVLFMILWLLDVGWFADKDWHSAFSNFQTYALVAVPIALVMSLLTGLPLGNRLARRGRPRPVAFLILGLTLGALPFLLLVGGIPVAMYWMRLGSWCGAWSALAYWAVVYRGSPSNVSILPMALSRRGGSRP